MGKWTLQVCKKVLRYLCGTASQGIILTKAPSVERLTSEVWKPSQLTVWTDAGYGGAGTRAQTGVLILWAGSPVLARSARQSVSALSTCESEVCAAATGWVCVEGLQCLLEEWHVALDPPVLLVDNRSALTLMRLGGSWRTRYFAVRAARIMEEHSMNRIQLRYCPTAQMGADGFTKLATGPVLETLRNILNSEPPEIPTADAELGLQAQQPVVSAALATKRILGCVPMIARRRQAEAYAHEVLSRKSKVSDDELHHMLCL